MGAEGAAVSVGGSKGLRLVLEVNLAAGTVAEGSAGTVTEGSRHHYRALSGTRGVRLQRRVRWHAACPPLWCSESNNLVAAGVYGCGRAGVPEKVRVFRQVTCLDRTNDWSVPASRCRGTKPKLSEQLGALRAPGHGQLLAHQAARRTECHLRVAQDSHVPYSGVLDLSERHGRDCPVTRN